MNWWGKEHWNSDSLWHRTIRLSKLEQFQDEVWKLWTLQFQDNPVNSYYKVIVNFWNYFYLFKWSPVYWNCSGKSLSFWGKIAEIRCFIYFQSILSTLNHLQTTVREQVSDATFTNVGRKTEAEHSLALECAITERFQELQELHESSALAVSNMNELLSRH